MLDSMSASGVTIEQQLMEPAAATLSLTNRTFIGRSESLLTLTDVSTGEVTTYEESGAFLGRFGVGGQDALAVFVDIVTMEQYRLNN